MESKPEPQHLAQTHTAAFTRSRPWSAQEFTDLLADPFTRCEGDATCFALYRVIADEAELLTIATHPDHQQRGLARRIMSRWHDRAASAGAKRAFLEVAHDNSAAIALYSCCGYTLCGRRRGYYPRAAGADADALVMERTLP